MASSQNKPHLYQVDFIRAVCAIGIICFHFAGRVESDFKILNSYRAGGDWGATFVTIFFALSGAMLYFNHSEIPSLGKFYAKRALSIFPSFWIAYAVLFIRKVVRTGTLAWGAVPYGELSYRSLA